MPAEVFNPNPIIFTPTKGIVRKSELLAQSLWIDEPIGSEDETGAPELIDTDEIFDLIRSIYDPEHPNTLEELRVVSAPQIKIKQNRVTVEFTPTVPHCGMSTLIGLCIRVRLLRSLPTRFKVDLFVKPGSHQSEHAGMPLDIELYFLGPHGSLVNKQLNDKERVAAALENPVLLETVEQCLRDAGRRGLPII